jgi:hypothetical protein
LSPDMARAVFIVAVQVRRESELVVRGLRADPYHSRR